MNKFIEEELNKVKNAQIEQISETEFVITKKKDVSDLIKLNSYYIIELADYITNPSENFTLASNWNRGIVPQSKYLKIMVTQMLGKMVKIDGCGFNLSSNEDLKDSYFGLWLPIGGIKIIKELR